MNAYLCDICGNYLEDGAYQAPDDDDDGVYCFSCCPCGGGGHPYDDEGDRGYAEVCRGEEGTPAIPLSMNNPRYPPRQSHG